MLWPLSVHLSWLIQLISYEMTSSVRFCISFDCFKQNFIALKIELISVEI